MSLVKSVTTGKVASHESILNTAEPEVLTSAPEVSSMIVGAVYGVAARIA